MSDDTGFLGESGGGGGAPAAGLTNPANVAITGGSITGTNVPYYLAKSSIPLIGLSTGSVAANGAISGITALPAAYPHAFCYFPANTLATVSAAGWYYCTFSTTTAGTAFLNSWTPGTAPPTVPTSPTAVTDGKGAFTGVTTEQGVIIPVAANAIGPNGLLEVWVRIGNNNSAGTKTLRCRLGGAAGTAYLAPSLTTTTTTEYLVVMGNAGVAGAQNGSVTGTVGTGTASASSITTSAVDTTAATDVRLTFTRNTATDNAVIEQYFVRLSYGA